MPEASDPFMSVGYLVAAVLATVVGLTGYGIMLGRRLASARIHNRELHRSAG